MGQGLGQVTFKHGRGFCLGLAQMGRGSSGKEGLWSVEFWSLEVGP